MSDELKKLAAAKALTFIEDDMIIGIGSGSTVNYFIDALASIKHIINAAVASSKESEKRLKELGIPVINLNSAQTVDIYIDGADEVDQHKVMIKGGGGALTREKIVASVARKFICIVHSDKKVKRLGQFPIAVEVVPMARSFVARELVKLGGSPEYRDGFITDNGNIILDVYDLPLDKPIALEESLKLLTGVVDSGLFAKRIADQVIVASNSSIDIY